MALFSQDDLGEDNERGNSPDFSGSEPVDPDAQSETPSPVEVDQTSQTPAAAQPDDASAYAQSPQDEEAQSDEPLPGGEDDGGGSEYAQPSASGAAQDSGSAAQLPSTPQYVDNLPNYKALEHEISNFKPTDYKPSVGRRIAAALSGGAVAFGSRNPEAGMRIANQVNDAPLNRARAAEQQTEQGTRQQIADVNAQNQQRQAVYQNQRQAANDAALNEQRQQRAVDFAAQAEQRNANWQPDDPKNPLGSYHATGLKGQPLKSDGPPPSVLKRPDVIAAQRQADVTSRRTEGTAQGLKGDDLNSYALTGKIPNKPNPREPRQPAVGEVEYNAANQAFIREHHRPPNTQEEINQVIQASKGTLGGKNDPSQIIIDSATKYADGLQRVPEGNKFLPAGSYVPASISAQDLAAGTLPPSIKPIPGKVYEDTLEKARDQIRQHGDDVDQNWNLIKGGGKPQPVQPAGAQHPVAPKTFSKSEIPAGVQLPTGRVWVKAPNGTVGHVPQANLQRDIARGYAVLGSQ